MIDSKFESQTAGESFRLSERLAFIVVIVINLLVTVFLARQVLAHGDYPFDNDEAAHALPALLMAEALEKGDWRGFVTEVYGQNFYPPGIAAFLIPVYLVAGPPAETARLVSVAALFLANLVLFALARLIDPGRGAVAGVIAVILTLTARPLLTNSALAMLEMPGLLLCLLLLWIYVLSLRRHSAAPLMLTGILLAAVFLTKYTFGLVALAAVGGNELIELRSASMRREGLRRWISLFGPFLIIMAIWFVRPGQLSTFFDYTQPLSDGQAWLSWANVLYYPRSLALHSTPSYLFAIVNLAGLIWGVINWRDAGVRVLVLFFAAGMAAVMFVNHPPNPRFITPFAPAIQLLTGLMIVRLWPAGARSEVRAAAEQGTGEKHSFAWRVLGLGIIGAIALASVPSVAARYTHYSSLLEARMETSPVLEEVAEWIATNIPAGDPIYLINFWDQFGPLQLQWTLATRTDGRPPAVIGKVLEPAEAEKTVALADEVQSSGSAALVVIEGGPWGTPFWPEYTAAMQSNLKEIARRDFVVEYYHISDWLDQNTLAGADWEMVKADSLETLEIGVIVYEVTR